MSKQEDRHELTETRLDSSNVGLLINEKLAKIRQPECKIEEHPYELQEEAGFKVF